MSPSPRTGPAVLAVLGSCLSLQFGAAIAVPLLAELGPGLTTSARLLIAATILLALHRPRVRAWSGAQWRAVLLFGVAMGGMNGFFYAAIARIPLGIAVTIEFAGPLVLAAVLSRGRREIACVVAAAGAIVVLGASGDGIGGDGLDPVGVAFAAVAAAFWAGYILAGARVGARVPGNGPLAAGMLVSALVVAPFGVGSAGRLVLEPALLLPLLAVALLASLLPYSLEFVAMRRLPPAVFGVLLALEPVVAGAAGWALLDQRLSLLEALAMLVVVAAAMTQAFGRRPVPETVAPARSRSEADPSPAREAGRQPRRPSR
ncbi:EamA family transporter [Microbacterium sp. gxy059]|uniref:EamA family transporter n=1 Tax=Microbacterium sp. gxy059 TaxID=2957199 RepID=UPI003D98CF57